MIQTFESHERGQSRAPWLDSRHAFSFGAFRDPARMGFRALRVMNEDWIDPASGFGAHPHRDMEILTYVIEGELEHADDTGRGSTLRAGDVQRMSAGTGIVHSEKNPSPEQRLWLLQIWVEPQELGRAPGYEERHFDWSVGDGEPRLLVQPGGGDETLDVGADVALWAAKPLAGSTTQIDAKPGRGIWLQLVRGAVELSGRTLGAGDAVAVEEESIALHAIEDSEFIWLDLA